jgi:hypothetical protein
MTELEQRVSKLEAARGTRPTPEERATFAELAEVLNAPAARIASGDETAQAEARTLAGCTPKAWFLPGRGRMRGGEAQQFASDWLLHRGIQAEATSRPGAGISALDQGLAAERSGPAGFPAGRQGSNVRGIQPVGCRSRGARQASPGGGTLAGCTPGAACVLRDGQTYAGGRGPAFR